MRTPLITLLGLAFTGPMVSAQTVERNSLALADVVTIESAALGETRTVFVSTPAGYEESDSSYQVLVLLDAETHFLPTVGLASFLSHRWVDKIPPLIVVGIVNTDRLRDVTPSPTDRFPDAGGVQPFLDFLEREVLPTIIREYRVRDRPILAGHSGSGLAVLFALQRFGEAFSGYIALDPSLDWDGSVTVREMGEFLEDTPELSTYLTFGSYKPKTETGSMVSLLERRQVTGLRWSAPIYAGETHNSMVHPALSDALNEMFTSQPR